MPTLKEIKSPHMKYCQRHDIHCSCITCSYQERGKCTPCEDCKEEIEDRDAFKPFTFPVRCHSIYKAIKTSFNP